MPIIQNPIGSPPPSLFTLEGADQPYRVLIESMSEGALTLSEKGKVIHCNKRFSEMLNIPTENIIGTSFFEYIPETQHELLKSLLNQSKISICKDVFTLKSLHISFKTVLLSCHLLKFGNVEGISVIATDITELNKMYQEVASSLKEKEVMLKEIYHRVKNNLQVVSSLLNLQSKTIQDPISRNLFLESSSRVKAMALVHEMLYQSGNLTLIEIGKYARDLSKNLANIYHIDSNRIKLTVEADAVLLNIEMAVPCGLIINELISNALKHAFLSGQCGEIKVSIKKYK